MSQDRRELLQRRLDQNYKEYLQRLQKEPFQELIRLAPEITAAQQLCEELAAVCDDGELEKLLAFDDPLELVRGYWETEISGYGHGEGMGHMLWEIFDKEDFVPSVPSQSKPANTPPRSKRDHEGR